MSQRIEAVHLKRSESGESERSDTIIGLEDYEYETLSDATNIRLIKLCEDGGPIRCSLFETYQLSRSYDALSYTWGSPTVPVESTFSNDSQFQFIICNGKRLRVTENLFQALLILRARKYFDALWIDAICINQESIEERNTQVRMMGDIFANARCVKVWLGKADLETKEAVTIIRSLGEALERSHYGASSDWMQYSFNDLAFYRRIGSAPLDMRRWHIVGRFFARRWFTRLWVLQEVALGNDVMMFIGNQRLPYWIIVNVASFLVNSGWSLVVMEAENFSNPKVLEMNKRNEETPLRFDIIIAALSLKVCRKGKLGPEDPSLQKTLEVVYGATNQEERLYAFLDFAISRFNKFDVGEARDRIFAPLSLASRYSPLEPGKSTKEWIIPDYQQDSATLCLNLTILLLKKLPLLSVLSYKGLESDPRQVLTPSWVPQFECKRRGIPLVTIGVNYNATGHWSACDDRTLRIISSARIRVLGIIYDSALKISRTDPTGAQALPSLESLLEVVMSGPKKQTIVDIFKTFCRTLVGDALFKRDHRQDSGRYELSTSRKLFRAVHEYSLAEMVRLCQQFPTDLDDDTLFRSRYPLYAELASAQLLPSRQEILAEINLLRDSSSPDTTQLKSETRIANAMPHFAVLYAKVMRSRRLMMTEKGILGLGPGAMQLGDVVAFVQNSKVPFVLRSIDGNRYQLVGEAYLDGLMRGELKKEGLVVLQELFLE